MNLPLDDDDGARCRRAVIQVWRQAEAPGRASQMQHLQDLGGLQLDQPAFEVPIGVRADLEVLDSRLPIQQEFHGLLDLVDLRVAVEACIPDDSERMSAPQISAQKEKSHAPSSRIRAQDLGEFVRIDQRQFDLGHDDLGLFGQRDFQAGRAMGRDLAGMACDLQCVGDALASAGIAICDEDRLGRHILLVPALYREKDAELALELEGQMFDEGAIGRLKNGCAAGRRCDGSDHRERRALSVVDEKRST